MRVAVFVGLVCSVSWLLLCPDCEAQAQSQAKAQRFEEYSWTRSSNPPNSYTLWRGGRWVGSYDPLVGQYRPRIGESSELGSPTRCPTEVPVKNFGLNMRKLYEFSGDSGGSADGKSGQSGKVRYSIKGKASSREKVFEAIKDLEFPPIPNHDAVRIVVIGDESRERVLQLIADQVARSSVAKKPLLDDFARTHWAVADSGYVTKGAPTVYFLRPDGVVIHRQDNEQDLLKALAVALRDPNPRYDPSQDPDLRRNTPWWPFGPNPNQPNRSGNSLMPLLLVLGGFGIVVLLILKGGSK